MSRFPTGVRSLDFLEQTKTLLVGTKGAEIIEVNQTNGQKIKTLIHGHFAGTP
jgi:WD40 repeat protein